jgi:hypothetical protein
MPEITAPPKWILFLLWPFRGESCYPQIEGDLSEEFQYRMSKQGTADARRWYRREVCRNLWSLAWRWATIGAIVLPLFCVALGYSTFPKIPIPFWHVLRNLAPVLQPLLQSFVGSGTPMYVIMVFMIILLLTTIIPGLAFPVICGALLRGHDRMIRLVFTAYCLGLSVIYGLSHFESLIRDFGHGILQGILSPSLIVVGLLIPVLMLSFIWISSIRVERHHRRKATGRFSSPA